MHDSSGSPTTLRILSPEELRISRQMGFWHRLRRLLLVFSILLLGSWQPGSAYVKDSRIHLDTVAHCGLESRQADSLHDLLAFGQSPYRVE